MELYILDREINVLGVFTTYEALIWDLRLHEPGTFKASFVFSERMNAILQRGNLIYKTEEEETAVITKKYLKLSRTGEETIVVQGYMTTRYLSARIIWNKMILSGSPEEVMRRMVDENAITPSDANRKIPRLALGELKHYGGNISKQITYDNLQEALTDISRVSELGYRLKLDIKEKFFYFEVYQGTDRRIGTEEPCIFSRDFDNVFTQEYSEDDSNYKNVCLIGGTGEDEDRIRTTVGEGTGLDRWEIFYNAAGLSTKDITEEEYIKQLQQKGKEKLANYYIASAFESRINQSKAMKYAMGDYVTCVDNRWGITENTQIKGIEKSYSKEEESIVITFGDDVPTLVSLIKAKE